MSLKYKQVPYSLNYGIDNHNVILYVYVVMFRSREQLEGLVVAGKKEIDTMQQGQNLWHGQPAPCDTVPLAEFVRMKSQLQDCIEMLRTENSSISDRLINMEKLRLKVQ